MVEIEFKFRTWERVIPLVDALRIPDDLKHIASLPLTDKTNKRYIEAIMSESRLVEYKLTDSNYQKTPILESIIYNEEKLSNNILSIENLPYTPKIITPVVNPTWVGYSYGIMDYRFIYSITDNLKRIAELMPPLLNPIEDRVIFVQLDYDGSYNFTVEDIFKKKLTIKELTPEDIKLL